MTVTVLLTGRLAEETHGRTRYEVDGPTVEAALQALPAAGVLLSGDELLPSVAVYLDGVDVRELEGLDTLVADGAEVRVVADSANDS